MDISVVMILYDDVDDDDDGDVFWSHQNQDCGFWRVSLKLNALIIILL